MELHARWLDWSSNPIAERMSFSSFSHSVDDIWGYDIQRPYQIVLRPGYQVPECLDKGDKDALWYYKGEVHDRAVIVWDGFCPTALFEIIRECFDYEGRSEYIAVRDAKTGRLIKDDRDPHVMSLRPVRQSGWGPKKIHNHITELMIWASMFPSGNKTAQIYNEMLMEDSSNLPESEDGYKRACFFLERNMHEVSAYENHARLIESARSGQIRIPRACCYGEPAGKDPERAKRDAETGLLDSTFHGMVDAGRVNAEDFKEGPPDSFYRAAVKVGQRAIQKVRSRAEKDFIPSRKVSEDSCDDADPLPGNIMTGKRDGDTNPF